MNNEYVLNRMLFCCCPTWDADPPFVQHTARWVLPTLWSLAAAWAITSTVVVSQRSCQVTLILLNKDPKAEEW